MSKKHAKRMRRLAGNVVTATEQPITPASTLGASKERPPRSQHHIATALETFVPMWVLELHQNHGPDWEDIICAQIFAHILGSHGDDLLFHGRRDGDSTRTFNSLAKSVAVLSYLEGGVPLIFGCQFDAVEILGGFIGKENAWHYRQAVAERFEAQLPVVEAHCQVESGSERTWDVTRWFETAELKQLHKLRTEGYSNLAHDRNSVEEDRVAFQILQWTALSNKALSLFLSHANQYKLNVACRIDSEQAALWTRLHMHAHMMVEDHQRRGREVR